MRISAVLASIDNPLGNVTPSMDFGADANSLWVALLAAVWGGVMIWRVVCFLKALATFRGTKDNPHARSEAKGEMMGEVAVLGGVVAAPVIIGAIIFVFSS